MTNEYDANDANLLNNLSGRPWNLSEYLNSVNMSCNGVLRSASDVLFRIQ